MRIACIGDLHGVSRWKEALGLSVDHYVFVGDYVDSYDLDNNTILHNLIEVLAFKKNNDKQVTLLLGNHDIQYLFYPRFTCTGFRMSMLPLLKKQFTDNISLFQTACNFGDFVFTHAGLSRGWLGRNMEKVVDAVSIVEQLNNWLNDKDGIDKLSEVGPARGGHALQSGPFWCDFNYELKSDPPVGFNQVVGHTRNTFLIHEQVAGHHLYNVNYLAYSDQPIFILEV